MEPKVTLNFQSDKTWNYYGCELLQYPWVMGKFKINWSLVWDLLK